MSDKRGRIVFWFDSEVDPKVPSRRGGTKALEATFFQ